VTYIPAIPLLPALAFLALLPLSCAARNRAIWLPLGAIVVSLVLSLMAFAAVWPGGAEKAAEPVYHESIPIATVGEGTIDLGLRLDPISAAMLLVITVVALCVQVFSLGYMRKDPRVGWYYAVLSLFTAAMLALVLADNFLMLYIMWEIMGLCSYLLIGFWHEKEGPRKAALKAFLTTRVGDIGFAIGLFVMFVTVGSFEFDAVLGSAAEWAPGVATTVALLLFFGAMGKSAQVPLHVWLPDAMAGPTPASALIHAATMVAAGVYLVARSMPIFEASGVALQVVLVVGLITAIVGGLLALVQHDIKKVLAYSTISQLGYMFIALGVGSVIAGMYHLITHAFFKSLLFLAAGVLIHAYHNQDMRKMGGAARALPITSAVFAVGSLALAGIFPFSGFWSKDEIILVLTKDGHYLAAAGALFAGFITAFYVARLWFRVFTRKPQAKGLHEAKVGKLAPMCVLAAITAVIGFFGPTLGDFLGYKIPWPDLVVAAVSSAVAVAGLAAGWWAYGRKGGEIDTGAVKARLGAVYSALVAKLYFDEMYQRLAVRPFTRAASGLSVFDISRIDWLVDGAAKAWNAVARVSWRFDDRAVDGGVNGVAAAIWAFGKRARSIQSGRIQTYQQLALVAVVLLLVFVVVKG